MRYQGEFSLAGSATGEALLLAEPLSLWGGLDPATGEIIDRRHPQSGKYVGGRILVLPAGRGSSSASSILLEAVKVGVAPAGIITAAPDGILALGAVVARELYGNAPPLIVLAETAYAGLSQQLQAGQRMVTIRRDGWVWVED